MSSQVLVLCTEVVGPLSRFMQDTIVGVQNNDDTKGA